MSELLTYRAASNDRLRDCVQRVFKRMHTIFGKKFTDQWRLVDEKDLLEEWCSGLMGFTPKEVNCGALELEKLTWPPLLSEFKKLCRSSLDPLIAYYESINGLVARAKNEPFAWSHPAVFWAASSMSNELQTQTYSAVRARWEMELKKQFDKNTWSDIPPLNLPALTYDKKHVPKEKLTQFVQNLTVSEPKTGNSWAHKILANPKNYSVTVIDMAREAVRHGAN